MHRIRCRKAAIRERRNVELPILVKASEFCLAMGKEVTIVIEKRTNSGDETGMINSTVAGDFLMKGRTSLRH